jgi:hypothetical protein
MFKELLPSETNKNICEPSTNTVQSDTSKDELWTKNFLLDELHVYLEGFRDRDNNRKYEELAKKLIYRIPIYRPPPPFVINKADLSARLLIELKAYHEVARNEILKDAVGRIFENIDERYYIQSVKRILNVELRE